MESRARNLMLVSVMLTFTSEPLSLLRACSPNRSLKEPKDLQEGPVGALRDHYALILSPPCQVLMGKANGACLAVCTHVNVTDHRGAGSHPTFPQSHSHEWPDQFWAVYLWTKGAGRRKHMVPPDQDSISEGPSHRRTWCWTWQHKLWRESHWVRVMWTEGVTASTPWIQDLESEGCSGWSGYSPGRPYCCWNGGKLGHGRVWTQDTDDPLSQGHSALHKQTTDQRLCICPWSSTDTSITEELLCSSMTSETAPCRHQQNWVSTSQSAVKSTWRSHGFKQERSTWRGLAPLDGSLLGLFT